MRHKTEYGALAQMVARNVRIVEVRGSNPLCSTRNRKSLDFQGFFLCFQNESHKNPTGTELGLFLNEERIIDAKTMRYIQRFSYSKNEISVA